ncbi:antiviral helicase [Dacryopinax primogenitus]|uniref:Antiviral helicase n=1 Tax=Dacryopinax primogenitus (strain DJM 731) TaxID=1858805 RepID=M5FS48_DACPD|nr:antiviral helicase [Dacryopinax primogenitus]EJU00146.1 antiviral helicase [Dacryopinax primogenitus]
MEPILTKDISELILIASDSEHVNLNTREELLTELGVGRIPSKVKLHQALEDRLLQPKAKLPDHWLATYQLHWEHETSIPSLLTLAPSPAPSRLEFVRAGLEGRVTGYREIPISKQHATALTSTSLLRAPAPTTNFVRGKSSYVPFLPGGLDDILGDSANLQTVTADEASRVGLLTVPPGFTRGLRLPGEEIEEEDEISVLDSGYPSSLDKSVNSNHNGLHNENAAPVSAVGLESEIDDLLPVDRVRISAAPNRPPARRTAAVKRDWADVVDVNQQLLNFHELVPDMARKYPFELDTFQKEAVYHLEMGDSVFVAAHTSAGKTVVAEYAIALAAKHMTRAIYTSPIKALSNQKFRDFKQTFDPSTVGILTGDVQINPEGSCLIMTTEILRSMLYKGADLIRDVEFVIFDEVHYVNDAERGVVWEEVIIMLPEHVNIILLSATVPNTKEFADWVGRTKKKDIYVISTPKRPVPLEHYLWAGREMHKIVDAKGEFLAQGYKEAGEALRRKQDKEREAAGLPPVQRVGARGGAQRGANARGGQQGRGGPQARGGARGAAPPARGRGAMPPRSFQQQDRNLYVHLVGHLRKINLLPVVVFTFSKRRCEENAQTLSNTDLCSAVEKSEVHVTIEKALTRLKGSDKKLPQIARMRDLLSRGIGVHHGGLLPIVKEVVEILFSRGLVKVLFATETFAMGVNMPARSVVFSGIKKHDGRNFRELLPGEYTQMSGRAGRRGLDPTGVVIIVSGDELPDVGTLHIMMLGQPNKLQSQFRLTYNMILNLLRVEALRVEEMIKRSFSENASQRLLPDQQRKVLEVEKELKAMPELDCPVCRPDIETFYDISADLAYLNSRLIELATTHPAGSKVLRPGRVVVLRNGHFGQNLAILLKAVPLQVSSPATSPLARQYLFLALADPDTKTGSRDRPPSKVPPLWPPEPAKLPSCDPVYDLVLAPLGDVQFVTNRIVVEEFDEIADKHRILPMKHAAEALQAIALEWQDLDMLPEVEWAKFHTLDFQDTLRNRDNLHRLLSGKACVLCEGFLGHYDALHGIKMLRAQIASLKLAISDQNLELLPDYEQRVQVLKDLKLIDERSTVLLKGRVACEINSASELILTELILENTLARYEPEEVVALLSAFLFQEKTETEPVIPPKLEEGKAEVIRLAERVQKVELANKVATEDFEGKLKFGLMEVVYEWARGMPFEKITELTDVPEGTIVRVITRLDETCREVRDAARVIGDADLFKKMEEAQIKIKRDIVFAASLYF